MEHKDRNNAGANDCFGGAALDYRSDARACLRGHGDYVHPLPLGKSNDRLASVRRHDHFHLRRDAGFSQGISNGRQAVSRLVLGAGDSLLL
jgi:hypothetical protein